jgi:hypothetical protein
MTKNNPSTEEQLKELAQRLEGLERLVQFTKPVCTPKL